MSSGLLESLVFPDVRLWERNAEDDYRNLRRRKLKYMDLRRAADLSLDTNAVSISA